MGCCFGLDALWWMSSSPLGSASYQEHNELQQCGGKEFATQEQKKKRKKKKEKEKKKVSVFDHKKHEKPEKSLIILGIILNLFDD